MSEALRDIIDSELLARLARMDFRVGQTVHGVLNGQHKSPYNGASVEFAQHRDYTPGDELKHIDWKAFGKSDRLYIKQFEDETNLLVHLLVDTSGSMGYARKGLPDKLTYAARLAAALAWLLLRQGDAVGLMTFGERIGEVIPPRARADHFWHLVRVLESSPSGGETNVTGALEHLAEVVGRRSLVVLLSDCLDQDERFIGLARQLQRRGHRVLVFHVLDPDEVEFPFSELTLFEEMESDARALADPRGMREQYLVEFSNWCEGLRRRLLEGNVGYHRISSADSVERALYGFLARSAR